MTETDPTTTAAEPAPNGGEPQLDPTSGKRKPGRPRGARDRKPRARAKGASSKPKSTPAAAKISSAQLRDALNELLTAPAVPYSMFQMDWPAQHVLRTGPELSAAIVGYSETNDYLRSKLEALARGENVLGVLLLMMGLVQATAMYVVPQLAYFDVLPRRLGEKFAGGPIPPAPDGMVAPGLFTDTEGAADAAATATAEPGAQGAAAAAVSTPTTG